MTSPPLRASANQGGSARSGAQFAAASHRVDRHRMVNKSLAAELAGGIHALAIHAYAPGEQPAN